MGMHGQQKSSACAAHCLLQYCKAWSILGEACRGDECSFKAVLSCAGNLMQIWVMALAFAAIAPIILPFTLLWCAASVPVAHLRSSPETVWPEP